ncbi:beta-lactamase family protein [Myxococcota bacterium]|nr:beta-lactamase family protein [Myxococcota bacterium]
MASLIRLPEQPFGVEWPIVEWSHSEPVEGPARQRLAQTMATAFSPDSQSILGETHAILIVHHGRIVAERYGDEFDQASTLRSWSIAKSILHAVVGVLVGKHLIDLDTPDLISEWSDGADLRRRITVRHLLQMSSGLRFEENYDDPSSDAREMLFGSGRKDMAAYATSRPMEHLPGTHHSYSSGDSLLLSSIVGRVIGGGKEEALDFMQKELFHPLGIQSAKPRFDGSGTFIGSSYVFATARDFARFGYLYLRNGTWESGRVLPEGWVDFARTPAPADPNQAYGAHFWLAPNSTLGTFSAEGYDGQRILIIPALDLVIVRLGRTPPEKMTGVNRLLIELIRCFSTIH